MTKKIFFLVASLFLIATSAHAKDLVRLGRGAVINEGETVDHVVVIGGDLDVKGIVKDDTVIIGGNLNVASTGQVLGDTVVVLGKINKEFGSIVSENVVELSAGKWFHKKGWILPFAGVCAIPAAGMIGLAGLIAVSSFFALFLLIAILFTNRVGNVSFYAQKHFWKSLLAGLISLLLVVPATLFLIVSIIGLPLVPLLFILISAATLFGFTAMSQLIGLKFFSAIKKPNKPMVVEVIAGFIIIGLIAFIPIIGWSIKFIIWLTGLGGAIATKFGTSKA